MYDDYFYDKTNEITAKIHMAGMEPNKETLEKHPHYVRLFPVSLHIHPTGRQAIEIARMTRDIQDESLLEAMTIYENSNEFSPPTSVKMYEVKGWGIYASENMINPSRYTSRNNLLFIDSGQFLYRIKIQGGFKSDIPHVLNSLNIEGRQLSFDYDENDKLISIGLK